MKEKIRILAIESSCDETSCAIVENGRTLLSNVISSQIETHEKFGGVVPEIASRLHVEAVDSVTKKALELANMKIEDIDAVAVTKGPGLVGALLVGISFAKGLASRYNKPLIGVHHLEGHIAANYIHDKELKPPFLALIVSGGHSHIVKVNDYNDFEIIGKTKDDAVGEAFDKVARVVGLGYPGGPKVDKLAKEGKCTYVEKIPKPKVDGNDFSFSGVKTAIINLNHNSKEPLVKEDLCASFQEVITDILLEKTKIALKETGFKTLVIAGGVSANSKIRSEFLKLEKEGIKVCYPPLSLCTDNAAMIAAQAYYDYVEQNYSNSDLDAYPNLVIGK